MPRRPRYASAPGFFHVINRSVRKTPLFQRPTDYRAFLAALDEGLRRHPARLVAYCVLPNHFHLVVGPIDPDRLSQLMHWVCTTHARRWHGHRKSIGQGPVYQGRFKAFAVQEAGVLVRVCRYVERNALEAGLVRRAQDWPWCSLSDRLRPTAELPLVTTPFLEHQGWIDYVNAPLTLAERLATPGSARAESVEKTPVPLHHDPEAPGGLGGRVEGGEDDVGICRADDQDEAHAHVEHAKHLAVLQSARLLQPAKHGRDRPASAIE
jgi:putative transposase